RVIVGAGNGGRVEAECIPQAAHVDGARRTVAQLGNVQEVRAIKRARVQMAKGTAGAQLNATAFMPPCSYKRGQAGDGAYCHAAACMTLEAIVGADGRGLAGGIGA